MADIDEGGNPAAAPKSERVKFPLRLFFALLTPATLLIVACGWYLGHSRIEGELSINGSEEINGVVLTARRLDRWLREPLRHVRALVQEDAMRRIVDDPSPENARQLEIAFQKLITYYPMYDKLRWIDETGMERVRVNNVSGRPESVVKGALQNKSDRYYFRDTMQLEPGQIFLSPLDLNVENGQLEIPYRPMLRLATPVRNRHNRPRGILIINVAASHLLDEFSESTGNKRDHVMLLNSEGYWLRSVNSADEWGFMFKRTETLGRRSPAAWKIISTRPSDQVELKDGLWTWSTVYPLKLEDNQDIAHAPHWLIISHLPANQLALIRQAGWTTVSVVALIVFAIFGALTAWLARAVASSNHAKVEAAHAHAEAAHAHAEAVAAQRLKEAQERYRMVVTADVNGLLVVDMQGNIVLANPALERMFGYATDELLGQPAEVLLPTMAAHHHAELRAAYMREPVARPMSMRRELSARRKDGSTFRVQISLSPFSANDSQYVLAVVADISLGGPAD
ncbi:MAG TPA: PAS domain S-box protein [Thiobacillaceae bacterium]|nr:PAS domain S-box protein [Thiobacillaceae bacterium]